MMSPRLALHRRVICGGCTTKCKAYGDGRIDYDNPAAACPLNIWHAWHGDGGAPLPTRATSPLAPRPYDGSAKWRQLHLVALTDGITAAWLDEWGRDLPLYGCQCQPHFLDDLKTNPLPATGQFAWSVNRHNAVNARLKRPLMPVAEALRHWSIPA